MSTILDIDFSIQLACRLLNASIYIDKCETQGKMVVTAENEDLRFALEFIDDSLLRHSKIPEKLTAENAVMRFETMASLTGPLKELKRGISTSLSMTDPEKRSESLRHLLLKTTDIEAETNTRLDKLKNEYPNLFLKRRSGCSGFKSAEDALSSIQLDRKSEQRKTRQKA
jgi:hypothetical protein